MKHNSRRKHYERIIKGTPVPYKIVISQHQNEIKQSKEQES